MLNYNDVTRDIRLYIRGKSIDYSEEPLNCAPERQRDGREEEVGVQELQDGRRLRVALFGFFAHLLR